MLQYPLIWRMLLIFQHFQRQLFWFVVLSFTPFHPCVTHNLPCQTVWHTLKHARSESSWPTSVSNRLAFPNRFPLLRNWASCLTFSGNTCSYELHCIACFPVDSHPMGTMSGFWDHFLLEPAANFASILQQKKHGTKVKPTWLTNSCYVLLHPVQRCWLTELSSRIMRA